MDCPACAATIAPGSTWCSNCGGALPAAAAPAVPPPTPSRAADPAASAAGTALLYSLPAFCCAPLSLAGAYYAARAVSLARQNGTPVPRRAVAAWVLVAVSLLTWGVFAGSYVASQRKNRRALQAVQQRLAGKREAVALDQQTACDLVEEHLRLQGYDRRTPQRVTCQGPLESGPDWALLKGVELQTRMIDHVRLNACLARTQRWFSLMVTSGERCPSPPPRTGQAAEAEEDTLRKEAAKQADEQEVAAFTSSLARVKEALAERPRATRACPRVDVAALRGPDSSHLRVHTVDQETLDAPSADSLDTGWDFLTSSDVRVAIDPRAATSFRARAIRDVIRESGPYLVVYQADQRAWPRMDEYNKPEVDTGGRFSGWLVVVDRTDARPLCEAALQFENSLRFWERKSGKRTMDPAVKDLKDQFERRATAALRGISAGQFRLGYRLVE